MHNYHYTKEYSSSKVIWAKGKCTACKEIERYVELCDTYKPCCMGRLLTMRLIHKTFSDIVEDRANKTPLL